MAKAVCQETLDGEDKLGEQTGLDTRVVPAVNDARLGDGLASSQPSAAGKPLSLPLGSAVARLKLKELAGEHHKG